MFALLSLVLAMVVVCGGVLSLFGSNRTRLFGVLGAGLWLLGNVGTFMISVRGFAETMTWMIFFGSGMLSTVGVALLAVAAIVPPDPSKRRPAPGGPGWGQPRPGAPAHPAQPPYRGSPYCPQQPPQGGAGPQG